MGLDSCFVGRLGVRVYIGIYVLACVVGLFCVVLVLGGWGLHMCGYGIGDLVLGLLLVTLLVVGSCICGRAFVCS